MAYDANFMCEKIKDDIKANFSPGYTFVCENFYGLSRSDYEKKLTRVSGIYILFEGVGRYEAAAQRMWWKHLRFGFIVIDTTMGRAKTKADYLSSKFDDFITGREFQAIIDQYPNHDVQPYIPEGFDPIGTTKQGAVVFYMTGYLQIRDSKV